MRLGVDFFPAHVRAFVSDTACDFKLTDDFSGLSFEQNEYLRPFGIQDSGRWVHLRQPHGKAFVVVDEDLYRQRKKVYEADAEITQLQYVPISIRTADCQSLFVYAADIDLIAVIHAGWKGVAQNITEAVLRHIIDVKGARPEFIKVVFAPSIRACCFEVQQDVAVHFPNVQIIRDGRTFVDLVQECRHQLKQVGVQEDNVRDCGICTFCNPRFFSFRREGDAAGRMINVMIKG